MFFNLNVIEYYPSSPIKGFDDCFSDFRGCEIFEVPVLRIFGSTSSGKKGCVHVHGVFPYFSVRWKDIFPDAEVSDSRRYTQELAFEIDRALNVSERKSSSSRHHVFNIVPFKGVHFYGFHPKQDDFIRIYFYKPYDVVKTAEIMSNGGVMNKIIQTYESHIPYILQFLIDYKVSRTLEISNYKLRASPDSTNDNSHSTTNLGSASMGGNNLTLSKSPHESDIGAATYCELELDCRETDISNKLKKTSTKHSNPGISALWQEEDMRRKLINPEAEITQASSQGMRNEEPLEKELQLLEALKRKVYDASAAPSPNQGISNEDKTSDSAEFHDSQFSSSFNAILEDVMQLYRDHRVPLSVGGSESSHDGKEAPFTVQCEDDSILGSKPEDEDDDYTTIEMSQRFIPDLPTSTGNSLDLPPISRVATCNNRIMQLDGCYDDDEEEEELDAGKNLSTQMNVNSLKKLTVQEAVKKVHPVLSIEESQTYPENSEDFSDEPPVLEPVQPLSLEASIYIKKYSLKPCCVKVKRHPLLKLWNPRRPLPLELLMEKGILPPPKQQKSKYQRHKTKLKNSRKDKQISGLKREVKTKYVKKTKVFTYENASALCDKAVKLPLESDHSTNKPVQVNRTIKNNFINIEKNNLKCEKPGSTCASLYSKCDCEATVQSVESKPTDSTKNLESLKPLVIKLERLDSIPSSSPSLQECFPQNTISESKPASQFKSPSENSYSLNPVNAQIKNDSKLSKMSKSHKGKSKLLSPKSEEKKKESSHSKKNFLKKSAKVKKNPYHKIAYKAFPNAHLMGKSSISLLVEGNESITDEVEYANKPNCSFSKVKEADSKKISKPFTTIKHNSSQEKERKNGKFKKKNSRLSSSCQSHKGINFKVLGNLKDVNLSKIGREVVLLKRLTQEDIDRFCSKGNKSNATSKILGPELFTKNSIPIPLENFQKILSCNNIVKNYLQTKKICRKPKLCSKYRYCSKSREDMNLLSSTDIRCNDSFLTSFQIKRDASWGQLYQFIRAKLLLKSIFSNTIESLIQNDELSFIQREGYDIAVNKEITSSAKFNPGYQFDDLNISELPSQLCSCNSKITITKRVESNSLYLDDEVEESNQSLEQRSSHSSIISNSKESSFLNQSNQFEEEELARFGINNLLIMISSDSESTKDSSKCTFQNQCNKLNVSWSDSKIITISTKSNSMSQFKVPAKLSYDLSAMEDPTKCIPSCSRFRVVSQLSLYSSRLTTDCYKYYLLSLSCRLKLLKFFYELSLIEDVKKISIFEKLFPSKFHSSAKVSSLSEQKLNCLALESSLNTLRSFTFGGKTIMINDANLSNVMKTIMSLSSFSRLTDSQWVIMQYCPRIDRSDKSSDSGESNTPAGSGDNVPPQNITGGETSANPSVENVPVEDQADPTPEEKERESKSDSNVKSDDVKYDSNPSDSNYNSNNNPIMFGSACSTVGGPSIRAVNVLASGPITNCKLPSELFSPNCSKPFQSPLPFAVKSKPFKSKANHILDRKYDPLQNVIAGKKSKPFIPPVASTSRTVQRELPKTVKGKNLSNKTPLTAVKNATNRGDLDKTTLRQNPQPNPLNTAIVQNMPLRINDIIKLNVDLNPRVVLNSDFRHLCLVGSSTGTEQNLDLNENIEMDDGSEVISGEDSKNVSEPSLRNKSCSSSAPGPSKSNREKNVETRLNSSDHSKVEASREKIAPKTKGPVLSNFSGVETTSVGNDLYDVVKRRTAGKNNPNKTNTLGIVPKASNPKPSAQTNKASPPKLASKDKPAKSEIASTSKYGNSEKTDKKNCKGQSTNAAQSSNETPPKLASKDKPAKSEIASTSKYGNSEKTDKKNCKGQSTNAAQSSNETNNDSKRFSSSKNEATKSRHSVSLEKQLPHPSVSDALPMISQNETKKNSNEDPYSKESEEKPFKQTTRKKRKQAERDSSKQESKTKKVMSSKLSLKQSKKDDETKEKNCDNSSVAHTTWKIDKHLRKDQNNSDPSTSSKPCSSRYSRRTSQSSLRNVSLKIKPPDESETPNDDKIKDRLSTYEFDINKCDNLNYSPYSSGNWKNRVPPSKDDDINDFKRAKKGKRHAKGKKKESNQLRLPKISPEKKPRTISTLFSDFKETKPQSVNKGKECNTLKPSINSQEDHLKNGEQVSRLSRKCKEKNQIQPLPSLTIKFDKETNSFVSNSSHPLNSTIPTPKPNSLNLNSDSDSPEIIEEITDKKSKLKMRLKKDDSNTYVIDRICSDLEIIEYPEESEKKKKKIKKHRRHHRSERDPDHLLEFPVNPCDIKKEPEDKGYDKQLVPPLKIPWPPKEDTCAQEKIGTLKLCRNFDNFYVDSSSTKREPEDSNVSPVVKRKRGRPSKIEKFASPQNNLDPLKSMTSFNADKPDLILCIKREPISDAEDNLQNTVTESSEEISAKTTRRRRSSLKVDSYKKYFDDSDNGNSSDEYTPAGSKAKPSRKRKRPSYDESDFPEYNPKASETSNNKSGAKRRYSKKDDDPEVVIVKVQKRTYQGRRQKRSSKTEDSGSKELSLSLNPEVRLKRLSTSEVEKHFGSKDLEREEQVTIQPVSSSIPQSIPYDPLMCLDPSSNARPVEPLPSEGRTSNMVTDILENKDIISAMDASISSSFQQYNSSKFASDYFEDPRLKDTVYPMNPSFDFHVEKELNPQKNLSSEYENPKFVMPHQSMKEKATKSSLQLSSSTLEPGTSRIPEQCAGNISSSDCTSSIAKTSGKDDLQRNCSSSFTNINPNSSYYSKLSHPQQPNQDGFFVPEDPFSFNQNSGYPFGDRSYNTMGEEQFNFPLSQSYRSHEGYNRRQDRDTASCFIDQRSKLDPFSVDQSEFSIFNTLNDASPRTSIKPEIEHFSVKKEPSPYSPFSPSPSTMRGPQIPITPHKQDLDPYNKTYIKEQGYSPGGQYSMLGTSSISPSPSTPQRKQISPSNQVKAFPSPAFPVKPSSPCLMRDNVMASRNLDFNSEFDETFPKNSNSCPPSTSFSQESMNFNISGGSGEGLAGSSRKPYSPSGQGQPFSPLAFQPKPSSPYMRDNTMVSRKLDLNSEFDETFPKNSNSCRPSTNFSQESMNFSISSGSSDGFARSSKGTQGKPFSPPSQGNPFSPSPQGNPFSPSPQGKSYSPSSRGKPFSPSGQGNPFLPPASQVEQSSTLMRNNMMVGPQLGLKETLPRNRNSRPPSASFSQESMNFNTSSEGFAGSLKSPLDTSPNVDNYSTHSFIQFGASDFCSDGKSVDSNHVFDPDDLFPECSNKSSDGRSGNVETNKISLEVDEFTSPQNLLPPMVCKNSNISSDKLKMQDNDYFGMDIPDAESSKKSPLKTEITCDEKVINFDDLFEDTEINTTLSFDSETYNYKNSIAANIETKNPIVPTCQNLPNSHLEPTKDLQSSLYLFSNTTESQKTNLPSMLVVSTAPNFTQCTSTISASGSMTSGINTCSPVLPFSNSFLSGNLFVPFSASGLNTVAVDSSSALSQLLIPHQALVISLPTSNQDASNRLTGASEMIARQNVGTHFNQQGQEDILSCIMKQCDIEVEFGDEDINTTEANQKNLYDLNAMGMSVPAPITDQVKNNLTCVQSTQPDMISLEKDQVSGNPKSPALKDLLSDSDSQFSPAGVTSPDGENSQVASTKLTAPDHASDIDENVGSPAIFPCSPNEVLDKGSRPSQELKTSSEEDEDLDSIVHSFYGEDTVYGLHPSANCSTLSFLSDSRSFTNVPAQETSKRLEESLSKREEKNTPGQAKSCQTSAFKSYDNPSVMIPSVSSGENYSDRSHPLKSQNAVTPLKSTQSVESISSIINLCKPPNQDPIDWTEFKTKQFANLSDSSDADSLDESQDRKVTQTPLEERMKNSPEIESGRFLQGQSPKDHSLCKNPSKISSTPQIKFRDLRKMASTPSTNRVKDNFLSMELAVSPINYDSTLTSGTTQKRRRKLSFEKLSKKPVSSESYSSQTGWLANQTKDARPNFSGSEIEGPSLENTAGFKVNFDETGNEAQVKHEVQLFTLMSLEVHVTTRDDLCPDPNWDSITAIFYSVYNHTTFYEQEVVGMIAVLDSSTTRHSGGPDASLKNLIRYSVPAAEKCTVHCVESEILLFDELLRVVRKWDPDILLGYEIQMASWGYLIQRASYFNIDVASKLSRIREKREVNMNKREEGTNVTLQTAGLDQINIPGRIILNVWRLMRKEVSLNVYSFENVYFHVLHRRTPLFSFKNLTGLYRGSGKGSVIRYYITRVLGSVQFLEKFDLIRRTSEMGCLFGIQFYDVLNRGSQFRVESMMLRSAAAMCYVPVSPTVRQRAHSRAPECVPLILEPKSRFYKDPVVVLDFQSLYPSMIIAYNYCFSTCLGRVEHLGRDDVPFEFGCTSLSVHPNVLRELIAKDDLHISPQGVAFVKQSVRRGILPRMLEEILNTRIMVKQSMKKVKGQGHLRKLLDARQMALKLISNVTYGYTAASFSGRMPNVEVADSIVGKGRETLERAIHLIENTSKWNAKVVYGDTDSVFILLEGRTKEEAFKIGQEMADAVTEFNPRPVKLKFEKVYLPCFLQTKKRYVGFMYETVDQKSPVFDAKGIETVRRDTCPAAAKILEKSLKTYFRTYDISMVQKYVQKQFQRLLSGRSSIKDCIFAKEFRGISGYRPGACVPALEIARNRLQKDPRSAPRVGERVPYLVVYGYPGLPIIRLVHEPTDLLKDPNLRINAIYYITRVIIPPLERVFNLMNTDVKAWYANIAKTTKLNLPMIHDTNQPKETITQYFVSKSCPSCENPTSSSVCDDCLSDLQGTVVALNDKIRKWERKVDKISSICVSCTKFKSGVENCKSIDCPVLFKLNLAKRDLSQAPYVRRILDEELF